MVTSEEAVFPNCCSAEKPLPRAPNKLFLTSLQRLARRANPTSRKATAE